MKRNEHELGSVLQARLDSINLSPSDREAALRALDSANRIVDAFVWIAEKVRSVGAWGQKPTVAH